MKNCKNLACKNLVKDSKHFCSLKCVYSYGPRTGTKNSQTHNQKIGKTNSVVNLGHKRQQWEKDKIRATMKRKGLHPQLFYKRDSLKKLRITMKLRASLHPEIGENHSKRMTQKYTEGNFKYLGYFFSQKNNAMMGYRSKRGELFCMQIFEQLPHLDHYECEKDAVPYIDENGRKRHTIPDWHMYWKDGTESIIEYKPTWKMKFKRELLKLEADRKYCEEKGWKFEVWSNKNIK